MSIPMSTVVLGLLCLLCVLNEQGISITVVAAKTNSHVHIVYLGERQHDNPKLITDSHHDLLATIVGSKSLASKLMVYSYRHGFSGFAAKLTAAQAQKFAELPDVVRVIPNTLHKLQTSRSWDFLGLSPLSPSSNILHSSNMGDGVIIGVLDTGIWPESKSFNEEGLGSVPSRWKGVCKSGEKFNATLHCNRKIIGARWFNDGILAEYGKPLNTSKRTEFMSPRDAHGHGTHTASTAAGSFVTNVSYKGLGHGTIRGGAPNARLAIYKVCWNVLGGQCSAADMLKGFDEAIHDGVDVLSLSIGGSVPLFSDVDERDGISTGSFHAVARGITVVCAASNDGPSAQTVQNISPWIITVAASTMDRAFPTSITLGNNKTFLGQAMFTGLEIGFTSLIYPESKGLYPTATGVCDSLSLNNTMVSGMVVLCFTSLGRRIDVTTASDAVKQAGGVGLIIAKNPTDGLYPCSDDFPCIEVDYEIGTRIVFYIRSTRYPLVKLTPPTTIVGKPISAKVAYFSSRGPNSAAPAILKPDVTAPGVNILAATSPLDSFADAGYVMHSGTSMSTPHVAGIVALIKAVHPNWSPAAIRSALVTTAWSNGPSRLPIFAEGSPQKLANPFDFGGGIVNPNAASNPGLVYDMGAADYMHYLCAMDYNNSDITRLTGQATTCPIKRPSLLDINLPSITIPSLGNSITVTRTVTNVGVPKSVYEATIDPPLGTVVSVKPNLLVFNSTVKKLTFEIVISTTHQMNTGYYFGSLTWTDKVHAVRIPLSILEFLHIQRAYSAHPGGLYNFRHICMKGVAVTEIRESNTPPRHEGQCKAIAVCWVLGLGTLFAWNSVVTIGDYYYILFPKYHPSRVLTLIYQPFALIAMAALAYNEEKVNTQKRILAGYSIFFLGTLMLIVVDLATSGSGGVRPYIGICAIVGALGVAGAHVEGGIVGDLSFMCPEFIQSFLSGLAAAGALTSVMRLITKALFDKYNNGLRKGAMLFLSISTFIQLVCILLYAIYFPRLPIVKYYRSKAASEGSKTVSADLATAGIQTNADIEVQNNAARLQRLSNKQLFKQNLDYGLGLFLTYALTLSIFPGFLYENTQNHKLGSWYPLVLITVYNAVDLASRYIPLVKCLTMESRKGLMIGILLRMLFVPAFYFTAKYGDLGWMMMLTSLLRFSNGYFTVCVMIVAPRGYQGSEQNALGNLLVLWLFFGVFAGLSIDWLWLADW